MTMENNVVLILGARGSVPVSGAAFQHYGGATTCVLVRLGGRTVLLDAGSGLLSLPPEVMEERALPLILSHPHIDHLLGLPMCPYLMVPGAELTVYGAERGGLDPGKQIERFLSPPLWPVGPDVFPAGVRFRTLPESLDLGGVTVEAMEGVHPGGVSLLRLTGGGRRVVFATDTTLNEASAARLTEFARGCDLLLCDGQYSDAEWERRAGFGHSSWTAAARLGRACGAKRTRVIHHDPFHTDAVLRAAEDALRAVDPSCAFAFEGESIAI